MADHSVVIAGGGPTGLMLAGELALAGADVAVVERRPNQGLSGARALGISSRIALYREDARTLAARDIMGELLTMEEPRKLGRCCSTSARRARSAPGRGQTAWFGAPATR